MPAVDEPGFWFSPPANAIPIALHDQGARDAWLHDPAVPDADRSTLRELQELLVEQLNSGGVSYAAHLVGGTATALLTVLISPLDLGAGDLLDTIGSRYAASRERCLAEPVVLPCGAAELLVEERTVDGLGGVITEVRTAQLLIPMPGQQHLIQLVLCSQDLEVWPSWMRLFGLVAGSVSFGAPGRQVPTAAISAALTG